MIINESIIIHHYLLAICVHIFSWGIVILAQLKPGGHIPRTALRLAFGSLARSAGKSREPRGNCRAQPGSDLPCHPARPVHRGWPETEWLLGGGWSTWFFNIWRWRMGRTRKTQILRSAKSCKICPSFFVLSLHVAAICCSFKLRGQEVALAYKKWDEVTGYFAEKNEKMRKTFRFWVACRFSLKPFPSLPLVSLSQLAARHRCQVASCHHRFCTTCIEEWATRCSACPLCKQATYSGASSGRVTDSYGFTDSSHQPKKFYWMTWYDCQQEEFEFVVFCCLWQQLRVFFVFDAEDLGLKSVKCGPVAVLKLNGALGLRLWWP